MCGENGAQQWVRTFIDQCRTGKRAELQFYCERGHLKVTMSADLGLVQHKNVNLSSCGVVESGSPSRMRRRKRRAAERAAAENAAAVEVAAKRNAAEKVAAEKCTAEKAAAEMRVAEKAAAEQRVAEKAAAEKRVAEEAAAEMLTAKAAAAEEAAAKAAAKEGNANAAAEEAAAKVAAESAATTAAAEKVGAKVAAAESPSREIPESDQATTSGKGSQCVELVSSTSVAEAEQMFSEFRSRWIQRLEKSTDDWALKTKLLESLEDVYLAPVSVLPDKDFKAVKEKFFQGVLSPPKFLEELQKLLSKQ